MRAISIAMASGFLLSTTVAFGGDSFHGLGGVSFGGVLSAAHGVSGDGRVVVGVRGTGTGFEAVGWTRTGVFPLGDLPGGGSFTTASDASFRGRSIVGSSESGNGTEAFLLTKAMGMISPSRE